MAKILIADDSIIQRKMYEEVLDYLGHICISCKDGKEAIEAFKQDAGFNLVILDYDMPEYNGLEVCQSIRQEPSGITTPIIVVSSHDDEDYIMNCMNAGANDYLVKPVSESHLIAKLRNFLQTTSLYQKELDLVRNKSLLAGRYQIQKILGYGSHSVVFAATDQENDNQQVAVKLLNEQTAISNIIQPFIETAAEIKKIDCDDILKIIDYGQFNNQVFLILEYADGGDLTMRIKSGLFDELEAVELALSTLNALAAFGEKNLLHLDIKPENIMIHQGHYKLGDFGIITARESATIPLNAELWSTVAYASPEMIDESGRVDIKSDIYSLGVTLYEAVTGDNPFCANRSTASMFRHLHMTPPLIMDINPMISESFSLIIADMLKKSVLERCNIEELIERFDEIKNHPENYIVKEPPAPQVEELKPTQLPVDKESEQEEAAPKKSIETEKGFIAGKIELFDAIFNSLPMKERIKLTVTVVFLLFFVFSALNIFYHTVFDPLSQIQEEDDYKKCIISTQAPKNLIPLTVEEGDNDE